MYRIFIADDEPIFLMYMRVAVDWKSMDMEICGEAQNGKDAIDYILKEKPDVAFLDITMPIQDGLSVCKAVREAGLKTRLVIMTAHDEFSFAHESIKLGVDDYLLKPFDSGELEKTLEKLRMVLKKGNESISEEDAEVINKGSTKYRVIMEAVNEFLENNYSRSDLSLSSIADELGFEMSYLRRVYKSAADMTIIQKLEKVRIREAKRLLRSGKYLSQEITEMTGFSDPFYFSKRFKQLTGVSPTEYQKNPV